jgi:hypothetical protein
MNEAMDREGIAGQQLNQVGFRVLGWCVQQGVGDTMLRAHVLEPICGDKLIGLSRMTS